MATLHGLPRILSVACLFVSAACHASSLIHAAQVSFDLPSSIECRDATPAEFATAHPALKVIEARFRISARIVEGNTEDIIDYLYVLTSADKSMRLHDYLPNTTLESAIADDQIEITDATEHAKSTGVEAHVVYKPFAVGGNHNQSSKKTQSSHYKQIASKDLVLASGTTNREHGVFFRLRPSRTGSLEGAKEFTFLATVPKSWRGDLCTISCTARAKKSSLLSTSAVPAGMDQAPVGMYLLGDAEAAALAEQLRAAQEAHAMMAIAHPHKENVFDTISTQAVGLFTGKKPDGQIRKELQESEKGIVDLQSRLRQMAK